jgi:hypothetical protein
MKFPRKEISLQCLDEKTDEQAQGQDRSLSGVEGPTKPMKTEAAAAGFYKSSPLRTEGRAPYQSNWTHTSTVCRRSQ